MSNVEISLSLVARLRAAGIKATPGRIRVLEALRVASQPLCHAELEMRLGRDGGSAINRVTLYRILDALVECGLAMRATDSRGVFRFVLAGEEGEHAGHLHFHCTACGGVFCLQAEPPLPPDLPEGFSLAAVALDLRGTCAVCAEVTAE